MQTEMDGPGKFQARVEQAAEAALKRHGSVGPLELLQEMQFLHPAHVEGWRKGNDYYRTLEPAIQVGPEKFERTIRFFHEWVKQRGLRAIEADYIRRGPRGLEQLQVTEKGAPEAEKFYRTHFALADLPEKKVEKLKVKLTKPPELVVFERVGDDGNCSECDQELCKGACLFMEKGQPLCLACADLDELVFLPAGDTAMTRRAREYSSLAAVVVRFNRKHKRYERQGLLVSEAALAQAEEECAADAPARALARARAALGRPEEDREFVAALAEGISRRYPGCPLDEARQMAEHAGRRSSGRVGRSAAGRGLEASALDLAVIAHIRHTHTNYDELLMRGTERSDARALVRERIDKMLAKWSVASNERQDRTD
jgi:hypothetical protein